jgi:hypothetical protein
LIIHILREPATRQQMLEMLQANRFYIKTAVDVRLQLLAGGGAMHSDCEEALIDSSSQQQDIWGASWNPISQELFFESMINLRPSQNRSMQILKPEIREQVQQVIYSLLGQL